jgi:hypothetical protein
MSHDWNDPDCRGGADDSTRERLPAFGDGALPPDAESDLNRLRDLFQSVSPADPEEGVWAATLTRVHDAIHTVKPYRRRSPRRVWAFVGLAAAAALVAVLLTRSWWVQTPPLPTPAEEPFPVVEAGDVDILSIDARDVAGLVVGEPPVSGELIFARMEDVRVLECKCCPKSGNIAKLEQGEVPMLVTTVARVDAPDDE